MSIENLRAFRQKVDGDQALRPVVLRIVKSGHLGEIVSLGRKHGFDFSESEIDDVFGPGRSTELSEFELELVTAAGMTVQGRCQ